MTNRYAKQELFLGSDCQSNLQRASAIIIGVGALGSSIAEMLVRAGIGNITIVDRDYVEWSNLQRQSLYTEEDARKEKKRKRQKIAHLHAQLDRTAQKELY